METLEQLNALNAAEFGEWLESRFQDLYSTDRDQRYRAFDLRELGIERSDSHLDALATLFDRLSRNGQKSFQLALRDLMRRARIDKFPVDAMKDIVSLIGRIKAYTIFRDFVPAIGSSVWGERHKSLIYDVLSVLLASPRTTESSDTARALIACPNFPDAYVFAAYSILVKAEPWRWSENLTPIARKAFSEIYREVQASPYLITRLQGKIRALAKDIVSNVPLDEIAKGLIRLKYFAAIDERFNRDLVACLVGPSGPLRVELGNRGLILVDGNGSQQNLARSEFEIFCLNSGFCNPRNAAWPQIFRDNQAPWNAPEVISPQQSLSY